MLSFKDMLKQKVKEQEKKESQEPKRKTMSAYEYYFRRLENTMNPAIPAEEDK